MEARNWKSQRELADAAGVSQATINKLLKSGTVKAETLEIMAENLNVQLDELYRHAGLLPPEKSSNTRNRLPAEVEPLIANIQMLHGTPHYEPVMRLLYQIVDYALFSLDAPEE